jgi:hypothetical protein
LWFPLRRGHNSLVRVRFGSRRGGRLFLFRLTDNRFRLREVAQSWLRCRLRFGDGALQSGNLCRFHLGCQWLRNRYRRFDHRCRRCGLSFNRELNGVIRDQRGVFRQRDPQKSKNDRNVKCAGEKDGRSGHCRFLGRSLWPPIIHRSRPSRSRPSRPHRRHRRQATTFVPWRR